ncbi:MAG: extracellular solute-binding protein [Chloroflexota bacterium]|nr:extracellular solute-binding protein [Chloroflexota bacterium]
MTTLRKFLALTILLSLLPACSSGGAKADTAGTASITISGAFALFPLVTVWTEEYEKINPNISFDVQAGGAGKGMTDMLSGAADIAMLSREPRQAELDQGAYLVPVTVDAVVGVFNAGNPHKADVLAHGITPEQAGRIWISGETTTWGQWLGNDAAESINVYTRSDSAGAAEMWALFAGGEAQEELQGTAVNADPGLAEAVRQDPLGVGYNNVGFAYNPVTGEPNEGLAIIPIDLNANGRIDPDEDFYRSRDDLTKAIATHIYPFPPARVLYLVTKGEPTPAVRDFFRWILNDGQAFVAEAGYVALTENRIDEALRLLGEQ